MTKIKYALLCFCLFFFIGVFQAEALTNGSYEYEELDNNSVKITRYNGTEKNVVIPELISGKKVVQIDYHAFFNNNIVEEITLPKTVTYIYNNAFHNCSSLKKINLNEGLETLSAPFAEKSNVEEIHLPSTLKNIVGGSLFQQNPKGKKISIATNNPYYTVKDNVLFSKDMKVLISYPPLKEGTAYEIPSSVTEIGRNAFSNNQNLTTLNVPKNVQKISIWAFEDSVSIEKISIYGNVDGIYSYTFDNMPKLKTVEYYGNGAIIDKNAFNDLPSIEKIVLPKNIIEIRAKWITNCNTNVQYTIPENLEMLEDGSYAAVVDVYMQNGTFDYKEAQDVLTLVNTERKNADLNTLTLDKELTEAAMVRARQIALLFEHTTPSGQDPLKIIPNAFGENIAGGNSDAESVMNSWMNSSLHKSNILASRYKTMGIGCYIHDGIHYWVQLFSIYDSNETTSQNNQVEDKNPMEKMKESYIGNFYVQYPSTSWDPQEVTLYTGVSQTPTRYATNNLGWSSRYAALTSKSFSFKSSNEKIFKVSANGTLTPVAVGEALLTVQFGNNFKEVKVVVKERVPIARVSTDHTRISMLVGQKRSIYGNVYPKNTTDSNKLSWSSSNPDIVKVECTNPSSSCTFSAVAPGTASITVSSENGKTTVVEVKVITEEEENSEPMLIYTTKVQGNSSWNGYRWNGDIAGTVGSSLRLEALRMYIQDGKQNYKGGVQYRSHIQNLGWETTWRDEFDISGTTDKGYRLEAMQMRLTDEYAKYYDIYYRVYVQNFGWLGWAKNGATAGSEGYGYRIEAMEAMLVKKGESAPGSTANSYRQKPTVNYTANVEKLGWQGTAGNGATAGTSHQSLRLEALKVSIKNTGYSGNVEYRSHVQNIGWETTWKKNNEISGTTGRNLRLEAVQIKLTGEVADHYDIYYRLHVQNFGWLGWAKNGVSAGSEGYGYRVEGIEIVLVKKGESAPGSTANSYRQKPTVNYTANVEKLGWQGTAGNGATAGTSHQSLRLEALKVSIKNTGYSGNVEYRSHVQNIGWETTWKKNNEISGTTGRNLRLEAVQIKLTGEVADHYDIYYRLHVQNFGWLGWAKNGVSAGSEGYGYRVEGIEIVLVKKGEPAPGNTTNSFKIKS